MELSFNNLADWNPENSEVLIGPPTKRTMNKYEINKKWRIAVFILIIICFLLILGLSIVSLKVLKKENICLSPSCIEAATNYISSIDESVDPCHDFYQFACGNWKRKHPVRMPYDRTTWLTEMKAVLAEDLVDILESDVSTTDPNSLNKAREIYQSCINLDTSQNSSLNTLWKILDDIGLPRGPPIKIASGSLTEQMAKAHKYLKLSFAVRFKFDRNPWNTSKNAVIIEPFNLVEFEENENNLMLQTIVNKQSTIAKEAEMIEQRLQKKYIVNILQYIVERDKSETYTEKELEETASKIINVTRNYLMSLFIFSKSHYKSIEISKLAPEEISIEELQLLINVSDTSNPTRLKLKLFLKTLFKGVNTLDYKKIDKVVIKQKSNTVFILNYLSTMPYKDLELMLWWRIILYLSQFANEDLRNMRETFLPYNDFPIKIKSRKNACADTVNKLMKEALGYTILKSEDVDKKKHQVEEVIEETKLNYIDLVRKTNWIDKQSKDAIIEKIIDTSSIVSYPDWIKDEDKLRRIFKEINVKKNNCLENMRQLLQLNVLNDLKLLEPQPTFYDNFKYNFVNAMYIAENNIIQVYERIINFPYFVTDLKYLNYGTIGYTVGHELSHGFDSTDYVQLLTYNVGRKHDTKGNLKETWSMPSIKEYDKRANCFIKQYSDYFMETHNSTVNGQRTLDENLADDGGLLVAYLAASKYLQFNAGNEPKLPGLSQYSGEQLFFLAVSNLHCYNANEVGIKESLLDSHSPEPARVNIMLRNIPEFSKSWNCPVGSNMNPESKCKLWRN